MAAAAAPSTPPQPPPLFNYTPESLTTAADDIVARSRAAIDEVVASTTPETATFENTLKPILDLDSLVDPITRVICFLCNASADADLRAASVKAETMMAELSVELSMREDIFQRIDALYNRRDTLGLDPESLHILEKEHKSYLNNGLLLAPEPRARFKEIQLELTNLCIEARNNNNNETGGVWFAPEQLSGIPTASLDLDDLEKGTGENEGKLKVGFKPTQSIPMMDYADKADTRREYSIAMANKVNVNIPIFKKIITLRDEAARMIGYRDHAQLRISDKMAKDSDKVLSFLADMRARATPGIAAELAALRKHKQDDYAARGLDFDGEIYTWDMSFYKRMQKEKEYSIDENAIAEYFSLWPTFNVMLDMFRKLLGVRFEELDDAAKARLSTTGQAADVTWHEDVFLYSVWDDDSGDFIGYLFLDMHPRDNKYSHFANFGIGPGSTADDGKRSYPFTALVCNFTKATKDKPALLKHEEVTTLFHELGHGIHNLVSKTKYSYTHGTAVSRDFVEAPSQMLENWCWLPSVLKPMSSHWKTGEKIPDALIDSLVKTKRLNSCIFILTQLFFGTFDLTVHGPASHEAVEKLDVTELWNRLRGEITTIKGPDAAGYDLHWGASYANIGHFVSGYDAGYYGYLYSEVFSADMFATEFKADPFNGDAGRRYRSAVLEKGGSRPEMDSLVAFLGREPTSDAFFADLGL